MHPLIVVPLYAAALGLLFLVLSARVILTRRRGDIGFGDGGDDELRRRIRIHANFVEYVPLALILLAMAEARGASAMWLNIGGAMLVVGRVAHAFGLSWPRADDLGRIVGMSGTQSAIAIAIVLIVST